MADPTWDFETSNPRSVRRDPFEAEFFTGEEESEEVFGRTDSLVREAIQNSLDARIDPNTPAVVRFAISTLNEFLNPAKAAAYLGGLPDHMRALGNELLGTAPPFPGMPWLVVEDFNTKGLTGDPGRSSDPADHAELESFYWFWRNVGRSGKSGTDRGRWGLGKTVFPATSRINALFGLTVRHDDKRALLMGQAVTKSHDLNGKSYEPEAFFHCSVATDAIQMPCEEAAWIAEFCKDFKLQRGTAPGLSIVVPYPFPRLKAAEIVRSVIVHYFLAILRKQLIVRVEGPNWPFSEISHSNIREVAEQISWDGRRQEKKHSMPPFELAAWAIAKQGGQLDELRRAGEGRIPEWSDGLFPPGLQERLRSELQSGGRIALRVHMTVESKVDGFANCFFDVCLERDSDLERSEDYFVREGMTIAGISTLGTSSAYRGLVMVDDDVLSNLLGDSEGPAHNDWLTGEARPDRNYVKWKRRVSFVKNSLHKLIGLLSPPPAGLDRDLLKEIFWIQGQEVGLDAKVKGHQAKKTKGKKVPPVPPLPKPKPKPYRVQQIAGGFRVSRGAGDSPVSLKVRVAYDLPDGKALKSWSPLDFDFTKPDIQLDVDGGSVSDLTGNSLDFVPNADDFEIKATGFDPLRDLFVDVRVTEAVDGSEAK